MVCRCAYRVDGNSGDCAWAEVQGSESAVVGVHCGIVGLGNDDWAPYACGDPCRGGAGAAVTNAELSQYLVSSDAGFISVDYDAIFEATNYYDYLADVSEKYNR